MGAAPRCRSTSSTRRRSEEVEMPSALRRAAGLVAGSALLLLSAGPTAASSGVSVDLGRIEITQQLSPGAAYTLPALGVRNPGTERTSYVMVASPVAGEDGGP